MPRVLPTDVLNRVYNRTTRGCLVLIMAVGAVTISPLVLLTIWLIR